MSTDFATLNVKVDTKGVKDGTKELKVLGAEAAKTEKRAISMGKAFGSAIAAYAVGASIKAVIANTIKQEKATAQLEATLRSTGRYTKELSTNLQEYAGQLQALTTYDSDAIASSQAMLLTFRQLSGDVFPRAQMAVLDFATALGINLSGAAKKVGQALNDPVAGMSSLGAAGITFTAAQKELVKGFVETNQLAKAQNVVLEELEARFKGSAAAAKNTMGGAIASLQNTFGGLLTGDKGSTTAVIYSINQLTETLNNPATKQGFQDIVTGTLAVTDAMVKGVTEIIEFDHWLGVVGKKYLGIDFAERSVDSIIRLNDEIASLNDELKDLISGGKGKTPNAFYIRSEIAKATKELDAFTKKMAEEKAAPTTPAINFAAVGGEAVIAVNKGLVNTLQDAQDEADRTSKGFAKMYADITAAAAMPDEKVDSNDVAYASLQAEQLLKNGDIDGAIAKAKQGFQLIDQMKSAGNLSDDLVEYYAAQFRDIGVKAGDQFTLDAQLAIDLDLAKQAAINAGAVMQETLNANPLIQQVIVQEIGGSTPSFTNIPAAVVPDSATQQTDKQPTMQPTIIKMPDGSNHTVYSDKSTADNFAKSVQKESMKRGAR